MQGLGSMLIAVVMLIGTIGFSVGVLTTSTELTNPSVRKAEAALIEAKGNGDIQATATVRAREAIIAEATIEPVRIATTATALDLEKTLQQATASALQQQVELTRVASTAQATEAQLNHEQRMRDLDFTLATAVGVLVVVGIAGLLTSFIIAIIYRSPVSRRWKAANQLKPYPPSASHSQPDDWNEPQYYKRSSMRPPNKQKSTNSPIVSNTVFKLPAATVVDWRAETSSHENRTQPRQIRNRNNSPS